MRTLAGSSNSAAAGPVGLSPPGPRDDQLPHAVEVPRTGDAGGGARAVAGAGAHHRGGAVRSWTSLATICDTGWLPARGGRRRRSCASRAGGCGCWRRRRCRSPRSRGYRRGRGPCTCKGHVRRCRAAGAARRCGASRPWPPPTAAGSWPSRGTISCCRCPAATGSRAGRRRPWSAPRSAKRRGRVGVRLRRRDRRPQRARAVGHGRGGLVRALRSAPSCRCWCVRCLGARSTWYAEKADGPRNKLATVSDTPARRR